MKLVTWKGCRIHFVGIGGTGMRGLAEVLLARGCEVSGSDREDSEGTHRLAMRGARLSIGHRPQNIPPQTDAIVYSAAIGQDNPERVEAERRGLRRYKYAEMLGLLMAAHRGIGIAGTHGKSTTSAMLGYTLRRAGLDPSVVVGANIRQLGGPCCVGHSKLFVAEACEYARSFHYLFPQAAAILNVEEDHLDYYEHLDEIIGSFGQFAQNVAGDGLLVAPADDPAALRAAEYGDARIETFAIDRPADWVARRPMHEKGRFCFDIDYRGQPYARVALRVLGRHNVRNALAAAALARWAGADTASIVKGLSEYEGAERRLDYRGEWHGVTVLDDYAHHPTEIRVTLEAARQCFRERRIWCIFQPHQHSRTRFLLREFADSFGGADRVLVPDIYFVRDSEEERRLIHAQDLVDAICERGGRARHLSGFGAILAYLKRQLRPGDVLLTMGAGDVWKIADELTGRLQRHHPAS